MLLILLLAACQLATTLVVTEDPTGPAVAVQGGDDATCMRSLSVYPAGDDAAQPLWRVSFAREDACVARIVYGQTPPGFDQDVAPAPLTANARYRFAATGPGFNDSADVTLTKSVTPPFAAPAGSRSR